MSDKKKEKEDKRAAALRANLRKRKIAQRGKAEAAQGNVTEDNKEREKK